MFISVLILVLLFIAGLISANTPTKKFFIWFQSLRAVKNPSHAVVMSERIAEDKGKKRSASTYNNKDELKRVFATFDKNNDGYITKQELKESLKNIGIVMEEKEIADMVKNVDSNGDGLIDLDEFCESFASLLSRDKGNKGEEREGSDHDVEEGDLKDAFDVFDGDKDGLITVEELMMVLSSLGFREGKKLEDCKEMIKKVDMDGDGMVNFDEFKTMMEDGQRLVPIS